MAIVLQLSAYRRRYNRQDARQLLCCYRTTDEFVLAVIPPLLSPSAIWELPILHVAVETRALQIRCPQVKAYH